MIYAKQKQFIELFCVKPIKCCLTIDWTSIHDIIIFDISCYFTFIVYSKYSLPSNIKENYATLWFDVMSLNEGSSIFSIVHLQTLPPIISTYILLLYFHKQEESHEKQYHSRAL